MDGVLVGAGSHIPKEDLKALASTSLHLHNIFPILEQPCSIIMHWHLLEFGRSNKGSLLSYHEFLHGIHGECTWHSWCNIQDSWKPKPPLSSHVDYLGFKSVARACVRWKTISLIWCEVVVLSPTCCNASGRRVLFYITFSNQFLHCYGLSPAAKQKKCKLQFCEHWQHCFWH
jgi:hypothetical protein